MIGGSMDRSALVARLIRPGRADEQECRRLSATKFIAEADWRVLRDHEREFLQAYAVGVAAQKAVLIGRSAASVLGIWTLPAAGAPVTLANPAHPAPRRAQWPAEVEYRSMRIPPVDIQRVAHGHDALLTTTRARTAIDIARMHGVRHGVVAMDSLFAHKTLGEREIARVELEACIHRLAGKPGIAHARKALDWSSTLSESPYESLLRVILRERGITVQEQMWIGRFARPDLLWGQLAIEIDGDIKFDENPKQAALEQVTRENWVRVQNYEFARVQPWEILRREAEVVQQILELKERSLLLDAPKVPATPNRPQHGEDWRRRRGAG